ncbi:RNI-like protein [Gigaspora margarita]|uniref:RNI-like protein n=1 Tax=Gigaspora margarita TaxID=4874 RepID=A0A8H4ANM0_GIGMA|nr:RNI-like protein [Gigaspora margarita]
MLYLPNEFFLKIFDYLRDDYKSLYSCLLVNRHWCRITVPILWSEIANKLRNRKLINTCLLSLNSDEQALIIPFNINLPNSPNLLFEYTSYVTSVGRFDDLNIPSDNLDNGVINWLNYNGYEEACSWDDWEGQEDWEVDKLVIAIKNSLMTMFLRTSKKLKYLEISGIIYNNVVKNLYCKNNLIRLNLVKNHFDFEEKKALIEYICKNRTLTSLHISYNYLESWGGKALAEVLYTNTSITSLILNGNNIGNEGGKAFAKVLYMNTALTSLNLSSNNIGDDGGEIFAKALHINTTLTSLNLSCNNISNESGKEIAKVLHTNITLTSLNLSSNNIDNEGGKAFAIMLHINTTLSSLILSNNNIGNEGGKALAKALYENNALTNLDLSDNQITLEGLKAFIGALHNNTTLITLNLRSDHSWYYVCINDDRIIY